MYDTTPLVALSIQYGLYRWHSSSINTPVNHLECIIFTPTTSMSTNEARAMYETRPHRHLVVRREREDPDGGATAFL